MTPRALVLLAVLASFRLAHADLSKTCPNETDIVVQGNCVQRQKAAANSALFTYQKAFDEIDKDPKHAFDAFASLCARSYGPACTQAAGMLAKGRGVKKDRAASTKSYEQACKLGESGACRVLAVDTMFTSSDFAAARKWSEQACAGGDPFGCVINGWLLKNGEGGKTDEKTAAARWDKAHKLFDKRCPLQGGKFDKNDRDAGINCYYLAEVYRQAVGYDKDMKRALAAYQLGCDHFYGDSCDAYYEYSRRETGQPPANGIDVLRRGCGLEAARACKRAALVLEDREPKSPEIVELAARACSLEPPLCATLAYVHEEGYGGTAIDHAKATDAFRLACEATDPDQDACVQLAQHAHDGVGMAKDAARATKLLEPACTAKIADACEYLAEYAFDTNDAEHDRKGFATADAACARASAKACYIAGWAIRYNRRGGDKLAPEAAAREALPKLDKACDAKFVPACNEAGPIYGQGLGVEKDPAKAYARYETACYEKGHVVQAKSCNAIAALLRSGEYKPADKDGDAKQLALRASARACAWSGEDRLGCSTLNAVTELADVRLVVGELDPACDAKGYRWTCYWAAFVRLKGSSEDKHRGAQMFASRCQKGGDTLSCLGYADALKVGQGIDPDPDKAARIYLDACEAEDPWSGACFSLMAMADEKKDYDRAFKFAKRACELHYGDACNVVGFYYYSGRSVARDTSEALKFYKQGCEDSSASACADLGEHLRYGIATPIDLKESAAKYKAACEMGSQFGCGGYAHFLATGDGGVAKDVKQAIALGKESCTTGGAPESCIELAQLLEREHAATPPEILAVKEKGRRDTEKNAKTNPEYVYWLGVYNRDGIAGPKDDKKARELFASACMDGYDPLGCMAAGAAFATSTEPTDRDRARAYFERACGAKIAGGCDALADLGKMKAPAPSVKAKGCGGCAAPGDGGSGGGSVLAMFAFAIAIVVARRRGRR